VNPANAWRLGLREFVGELLHELDPRAELVALVDAQSDNFGLQVNTPDDVGKMFLVSKRLVEDAPVDPIALKALCLYLRSEVLHQQTRRTVNEARERRSTLRGPPGQCEVCGDSFRSYERVVVRRARIVHVRCLHREPPA
jgi:hypothetical protein